MKSVKKPIDTDEKWHSQSWIAELEGKWVDSKSAEEMIFDIKSSRTKSSRAEIELG